MTKLASKMDHPLYSCTCKAPASAGFGPCYWHGDLSWRKRRRVGEHETKHEVKHTHVATEHKQTHVATTHGQTQVATKRTGEQTHVATKHEVKQTHAATKHEHPDHDSSDDELLRFLLS